MVLASVTCLSCTRADCAGPLTKPGAAIAQRELISTGCITLLTTYSPISSPIFVPTRVEER